MVFLDLNNDRDRYKLVYVTFLGLGISTLMAFNSFLSAPDFTKKFYQYCNKDGEKAVSQHPDWWENIESYSTVASLIPNFIGQLILITDWGRRSSIQIRLILSMLTMAVCVVVIPVLTYFNVSEEGAFAVYMTAVVVTGAATAVCQATCFALSASFPPIYTGAVLFGIGLSGSSSSIARIITKSSMAETFENTLITARIYFYFSCGVILLCLLLLLLLRDNPYAIRFVSEYREAEGDVQTLSKAIMSPAARRAASDMRSPLMNEASAKFDDIPDASVRDVVRVIKDCMFSVFYIFFVTLAVFPGVGVHVDPSDAWFGVIIVAMFNIGDTVGRMMSNFECMWIPRRWLPGVAVSRTVWIVLFVLSINPKVIHGHYLPWAFMFFVGVTNGLPGSVSMIYGPMTEDLTTEKERHTAGTAMSISLLLGSSTGSLLALLVTSQGWL